MTADPVWLPADGPYFEDLSVGDRFTDAPSLTLTAGHAAVHQAVLGDRLRLCLDQDLSLRVTGEAEPLLHPALVWDVAIGQSSEVTRNVVANLFYRGLVFSRFPHQGDTLTTQIEVVALRQNRSREGRPSTGLAVLRIRTFDQLRRPVLDFLRCAMLRLRNDVATGQGDDLDQIGNGAGGDDGRGAIAAWALDLIQPPTRGMTFSSLNVGQRFEMDGADVVSAAPELARLTLNIARVHHDGGEGGSERLVYGGHTIGLALSQATRMLPSIVTVTAWQGCDHLAPVWEGAKLRSTLTVLDKRASRGGSGLIWLRSEVRAGDAGEKPVLDWRFAALVV
jgi:acyl dehydratase